MTPFQFLLCISYVLMGLCCGIGCFVYCYEQRDPPGDIIVATLCNLVFWPLVLVAASWGHLEDRHQAKKNKAKK